MNNSIVEVAHINEVLDLVRRLAPSNGDKQLLIVAFALVVGCKALDIDRDTLFAQLEYVFDQKLDLVPLKDMRQ